MKVTPTGLILLDTDPEPKTPRFRCLLCKKPFFDGEHREYERHIVSCAQSEHAEEAEKRSLRRKIPEMYDPRVRPVADVEAWLRENRAEMREGRKKL